MSTSITKPNTQTYMITGIGGVILAIAVVALIVSAYIVILSFVAFTILVYFFILLCGVLAHIWNKILGRWR